MPKIEIDVSDLAAAQLQELCAAARREHPDTTDADVLELVLATGVGTMLCHPHYPNNVLALLPVGAEGPFSAGEVVTVSGCLPLGSRIVAMVASPADGPHWEVNDISFGRSSPNTGALRLLEAVTPLSELLYLTTLGLLSPFKDAELYLDVRVSVTLRCKTAGATFSGYRLYLRRPEQVCSVAPLISVDTSSIRGPYLPPAAEVGA